MKAQSVRVRFPDGSIRPVSVEHWVEQIVGRPVGGGAPVWSQEPDWPRIMPGYDMRRVMESKFDYIAFERSGAPRDPA